MSNRTSIARNRGFASLSLGLLLGLTLAATPVAGQAQETKAAPAADRQAARRTRLPPYYGRVATVDQRAALDKIQAAYAPKIEKLREELDKLLAARDAELRAALGVEQQKQLDEMAATARERRRNRSARNAAAATAATDASASRTVKPAERTPAKQ